MIARDAEGAAALYERLFGLARMGVRQLTNADGIAIDLSDGEVNLAVLGLRSSNVSLPGSERVVGPLHLGVRVKDGGQVLMELAQLGFQPYAERGDPPSFFKFRDREGIEFDVATAGNVFPYIDQGAPVFGIRHIAYVTSDPRQALTLFGSIFGLTHIDAARTPFNYDGTVLDMTDGHVHLGLTTPRDPTEPREETRAGLLHIGVTVAAPEQLADQLRSQGFPVHTDSRWPSFFKTADSDGVEIDVARLDDVFQI